jgi:hypothetical protein
MFPWEATPPHQRGSEARDQMYRRELEQRAALLYRLNYSAKQVKARLSASVAWDFELHGRPKHALEIDRIVDAVFRRGGPASGGLSV